MTSDDDPPITVFGGRPDPDGPEDPQFAPIAYADLHPEILAKDSLSKRPVEQED